jgi:pilus assembly protein CpaC
MMAMSLSLAAVPAALAQSPAPPPSGLSDQDSTNDLSVTVGKTVLVDCTKRIERVSVGLGEFAEATAVSPTEILVNGKAAGETSLIIWEAGGVRQIFNVSVRPSAIVSADRLEEIRRELRTELPGQSLKLTTENGALFLRGTVKDLNSSERAVQISSTAGKVVNLLYVKVPPPDPQILLKVRFASVDRSLSRQLGLNLFSTGAGNTIGGISTGQFSPPTVGLPTGSTPASATISNALNLMAFYPGINLGATIEALEAKGLVQTLAEPNVLAENGKQASFLAGGEYPYPVVQGTGGSSAVTIEFKEYGVRLNFIPTITARGTIRLQVAPEVSALDFTNAIEVSGFNVPAINTRKVKTVIELTDGQSFAIGGLLDNRETETFQKIPFLGDIPILGKLFQSINRNKTNTELIVIVTPEIVKPISAGAPLPDLKYPVAFLPSNSGIPMNTPDGPENRTATTAAGTTPAGPPSSMPVEQMLQTLQPDTPLVIETSTGKFGTGSTSATTAAPSGVPVTPAPPQ